MRKILSLTLLMILFLSCNRNIDYAYSIGLNIKNCSSHSIEFSITEADWPWEGKTYTVKAGNEILVKENADGIPELNIRAATVCFDSAVKAIYTNAGDASEYNVCNTANWILDKDNYSNIWIYTFTDEDYDYAIRLAEH